MPKRNKMSNIEEIAGPIPENYLPELMKISTYTTKKGIAQGLMDIALFSANTNQMRSLIKYGVRDGFLYFIAGMLALSLTLQLVVGVLLVVSMTLHMKIEQDREKIFKIGNYVVSTIFMITVLNVFIVAFGGPIEIVTQ